jgi:hypothetical protein
MMEYYKMFIEFATVGQMGFWTYWLPMILCFIGYTGRTWYQIQELRRVKTKEYEYLRASPLTVGTLLGRLLLSVTPIVNIIALVFGLSYDMMNKAGTWIGNVLSFELVKKRT